MKEVIHRAQNTDLEKIVAIWLDVREEECYRKGKFSRCPAAVKGTKDQL